jgi:hypothetical protein
MVREFATEEYATRAVSEVGRKWAKRDPLVVISWLNNLPKRPGQNAGLSSAFSDWQDRDPFAVGNYLLSMPDSKKRDLAIRVFAIVSLCRIRKQPSLGPKIFKTRQRALIRPNMLASPNTTASPTKLKLG